MKKYIMLMIFFSVNIFASLPYVEQQIKGRDYQVRKSYFKKHKKFFKKICRPGTEEHFWKLTKKFRGEGFFIPRLVDGSLDKRTVGEYLPEIDNKIKWIEAHLSLLKKKINYKNELTELKTFQRNINELLLLKERFYDSEDKEQKKYLKEESAAKYRDFSQRMRTFLEGQKTFQSYHFPVDHLQLRTEYDQYKKSKNDRDLRKANRVYFHRRLTQDGTFAKGNIRSDRFTRTLIDTLYYGLKKPNDFIDEDIRYDLESLMSSLNKLMREGVNFQRKRLTRWLDKMKKSKSFYADLHAGKINQDGHVFDSGEYVKKINLAREELRSFVYKKEAEVYKYWMKHKELDRALFVLSTILFNEVGKIDGHDALERKDVLHVVMNRFNASKYNKLSTEGPLFSLLGIKEKEMSKYPWLNVLFKEGEFSFTYYFISGSAKIFCPDMSRAGRKLRLANIKHSMRGLKEHRSLRPMMRYFSRASMLGRIRMDSLWNDYVKVPEKPGIRIKNPKRLVQRYNNGEYEYLYHFESDSGRRYKVLRIGGATYTLDLKTTRFYTYRNPHLFRYFKTKTH